MSREWTQQRSVVLIWIAPALLFAALYGRALDYDFVWTDQGEIELGLIILPPGEIHTAFGRPMLSGLETVLPGASAPYYRPLQVIAASTIDHQLGRSPRNFRALNLVLGMATASTVAWLAWLLFASPGASLAAGMIFALHPANLENHVWIAGLSQSLASFFVTASLAFSVLALRDLRWRRFAVLSLAGLLGALLSKENAAITPALFLALAISLVARSRRSPDPTASREILRRARIVFALQVALTLGFVLGWRPFVLGTVFAEAQPIAGSQVIQILTAIGSWPHSIGWLIAPLQSTTSDVVVVVGSPLALRFVVGVLLATGSLYLWLRLLGSRLEWTALGLAWIWIAFAPTSGLIPLNHMRGERYLSLSLLGLAVLLPAIGLQLRERLAGSRREWIVVWLAIALAFGLAQRSWHRMPDWRSNASLFASDVARDPLYREGYHELAKAQIVAGDLPAAKASLMTLSQLGDRFRGHTSFLRGEDAIRMLCQLNLQLGEAQDSMRFFATLGADSPQIESEPATSLCAGRTLRAVGRNDSAEAVLGALATRAPEPVASQAALELVDLLVEARRERDAATWISHVSSRALPHPAQRTRYQVLQRRLERFTRGR